MAGKKCFFCGNSGNGSVDTHHYYPRPYRTGPWTRRQKVPICIKFHRWLHRNYTNRTLAAIYNNHDSLYDLWEEYQEEV